MDNITHSLLGAVVGHKFARWRKLPTYPVVATSVLANNFPDLDILYASAISKPFGFLLHHRGHTHTFLGALVCAILCYGAVVIFYRLKRGPLSSVTKRAMLSVAALGAMLHIGLDWLNTYGVHPFWPISREWVYGDTLFIIEPTLWLGLGGALCSMIVNRFWRILCAFPVALGLGLILALGKVPFPALLVWAAVFGLAVVLSSRIRKVDRSAPYLAATALVVLIFWTSRLAAEASLASHSPSQNPIQEFLTPSPANPFCWGHFTIVATNTHVKYQLEYVQPFAQLLSLDCQEIAISSFRSVNIRHHELDQFKDNCHWNAFLQFSRVPGIKKCEKTEWCTADFRFESARRKNFSLLPLPQGETCPTLLPDWKHPTGHPVPSSM